MKSLIKLYESHQGKVTDKWVSYLTKYDEIFKPYRNKPISILEIGIQNGGSLEIWSQYFKNAKQLVGCDINHNCRKLQFSDTRISVIVEDANSLKAEKLILKKISEFDLIIDDGSHRSSDIIKSFSRYFPHLKDNGLYITEDLHCSYWQNFEGGIYYPFSSISFFKRLIDIVNHHHIGLDVSKNDLLKGFNEKYQTYFSEKTLETIDSIEFINSMCILRKSIDKFNWSNSRIISGRYHDIVVPDKLLYIPDENLNPWSNLEKTPDESYEELKKTITSKNLHIDELSKIINQKLLEINLIKQSLSWRITIPLRWFKTIIKKMVVKVYKT